MGKGIEIREAHFPERAPIDAYGNGGFRFAEMSHRGGLMCLPSGIYGWEPAEAASLSVPDLDRVISESAGIDILLVGTGADIRPLRAEVRSALLETGVRVEPMNTGAAVRTYNVLLSEGREVAAVLIAVD